MLFGDVGDGKHSHVMEAVANLGDREDMALSSLMLLEARNGLR
ncbi:hypothetical protein [Rhodomicrobium sp.]